uniref:Uncharacterized protein n=1 Tax=viral metagenome TaxID=1070528 RepID=A0A6M3IGL9_9ZZZZ
MSKWDKAEGKVISVRIPEYVYAFIKGRADDLGVTVGEYVRNTLTKGVIKYVNVPE